MRIPIGKVARTTLRGHIWQFNEDGVHEMPKIKIAWKKNKTSKLLLSSPTILIASQKRLSGIPSVSPSALVFKEKVATRNAYDVAVP